MFEGLIRSFVSVTVLGSAVASFGCGGTDSVEEQEVASRTDQLQTAPGMQELPDWPDCPGKWSVYWVEEVRDVDGLEGTWLRKDMYKAQNGELLMFRISDLLATPMIMVFEQRGVELEGDIAATFSGHGTQTGTFHTGISTAGFWHTGIELTGISGVDLHDHLWILGVRRDWRGRLQELCLTTQSDRVVLDPESTFETHPRDAFVAQRLLSF
ncbi:MAG: hypothetical protein WBV82_26100 [Myxococcaceae bacterium]